MLTLEFTDHEELAASVPGWTLEMRRLDPGPFRAVMAGIDLGGVLISRFRFNRSLEIEGATPEGLRSFALPGSERCRATWCGQDLTPDRICVYEPRGSFEGVSYADFDSFEIAITEELLLDTGRALGLPPVHRLAAGG